MFRRTHNRRATDTAVANKRNGFAILLFAGAWLCAFVPVVKADDSVPPIYETVVNARAATFFSAKDEAASAVVVTSNRTARSGETVEQIVSELPGVAVTRYGGPGALSTISIRGSTPSQVQVYVDDIPLNLATGGGVDIGFIPIWGMERLELFKGSSPIAFGATGIGGLLHVATQSPEENTIRGAIGVGSWGTQNLAVSGSYLLPSVRASVSLSASKWLGNFRFEDNMGTNFDPTDDRATTRSNNDLAQQDGVARLVFPLGENRSISVISSFDNRDQGVPGLALFQATQTRLHLGRQTTQLAYASQGDLGPASRVRANAYVLHMTQAFSDPLGEIAASPSNTDDTHLAFGSTWRAGLAPTQWLRLKGVLDLRHESFVPRDSFKNTPSGPPGTRDFIALGIEPSAWIKNAQLEITPSARLEVSRDVLTVRNAFTTIPSATDPRTSFLPVLRLSATHQATEGIGLRTNVSRYVRAPSTTERYGNTGFIVANPSLDPETGINADAGARFSFERRSFSMCADAALFASWVSDLIQFQQNSQGQARASNIGKARIAGGELAVGLTAFKHLKLTAQTTYTDAIDTSDIASRSGKQLPLRPRTRIYGRPEIADISLGAGLRSSIYGDVDFTSGNYRDPANLVKVPSRLLLGAGASVSHSKSGIRLIFSASNLTNAFTFDLTGFPLPGRSLFMTLDWASPLTNSSLSATSPGAS